MDLSPVGLRWLVLKTNCLHWIIPHPTSLISVYADEIADITEPVQTVTELLSVLLSLRRQSHYGDISKLSPQFSSDPWCFCQVLTSDSSWQFPWCLVTSWGSGHCSLLATLGSPGHGRGVIRPGPETQTGNFDQFDPLQLPITRCCPCQPITERHWHLLANERPGLESPVKGKVYIQFAINTQLLTDYCAPVIGPVTNTMSAIVSTFLSTQNKPLSPPHLSGGLSKVSPIFSL